MPVDAIAPAGREPAPPADPLPLSLLNDFLYCPRRAALKLLEGWRGANVHTERGDIVHEHTDLSGYEVIKGTRILRALPVFSTRLALNGRCDLVEVRPDGSLYPVEFKLGKRRCFANDDVQLCAQALCLEEMLGGVIERGAVFHAASKRRREVHFTAGLRALTETTVESLRGLCPPFPEDSWPSLPAAVYQPACEECSLYELCLPQVCSRPPRWAQAALALFRTEPS